MELLCGREMVLKTERGVVLFLFLFLYYFLSPRLCVFAEGKV